MTTSNLEPADVRMRNQRWLIVPLGVLVTGEIVFGRFHCPAPLLAPAWDPAAIAGQEALACYRVSAIPSSWWSALGRFFIPPG